MEIPDEIGHLIFRFESSELRKIADWLDEQRSARTLLKELEEYRKQNPVEREGVNRRD